MSADTTEEMELSFRGFGDDPTDFRGFDLPISSTSNASFEPPMSSTSNACTLNRFLAVTSILSTTVLSPGILSQVPGVTLQEEPVSIDLSPRQFLEDSLDDIPLPCYIEDEDDEIPDYTLIHNGSQRNGHVIVDSNGYEYTFKVMTAAGECWRCPKISTKLHCNAVYHPGRVDKNGNPKDPRGAKKTKHICMKKYRPQFVRKLRADLKREGLLHLLETAISLVKKEMKGLISEEEQKLFTTLPSQVRLAAQVNYYRRRVRPQQIKTLQFEMNHSCIPEDFLKTDINDGESRHIIFATAEQLKRLANAVTWYVDGTFKIVKLPFVQMFSVHVFVKSGLYTAQIPVAFVMMSGRTSPDYVAVFKALLELVPQTKVERIVLDFEKAVWSALYGMMERNEFPKVTIKGCFFHFTQAVFRRIQNLGMKTQYVRDLGTKDICRRMMSLPLLPHECVPGAFQQLKQRCDDSGIECLQKFGDYVKKNWIDGWFGPKTWVCYTEHIRTNNHVEGYHRGLNFRVRGTKVNFYSLVQVLYEEALSATTKAVDVDKGLYKVAQALPEKRRNEELDKLWALLRINLRGQPGGMSAERFLANASKKTSPDQHWDGSRVDLDGEDDL